MEKIFLLENFFQEYQHTVAAFGVIATFSAVFVALRQYRSKVEARFEIIEICFEDRKRLASWVHLIIVNKGVLPIFINNFFSIKIPFSRTVNLRINNINEDNDPDFYRVEPKQSKSFHIDNLEDFQRKISDIRQKYNRIKFLFLRYELRTNDNVVCKIHSTKGLI